MSRKFLAIVALILAVLLPTRGFAAHFIAACEMGTKRQASAATTQHHAMPCHEMMHQANAEQHKVATSVDTNQEACKLHCSACAASCSAPLVASTFAAPQFEVSSSVSLPMADFSYQSALITRADKPPVL